MPTGRENHADGVPEPNGRRHVETDVFLFSRERVRELDRACVERTRIPGILLMENAAIGLADAASRLLGTGPAGSRVLIVCGPGNNGGDGLAMGRHLANRGAGVAFALTFDPPSDLSGEDLSDARRQLAIALAMGLAVEHGSSPEAVIERAAARLDASADAPPVDLVVDAILGTGASRPLESDLATAVDAINRLGADGAAVLAVDVPTGLDAESGGPLGGGAGPAVKADLTVTLAGLKPAFLTLDAQPYVGDVVVEPIGAPVALLEAFGEPVTDEMLRGPAAPMRPGDAALHGLRDAERRRRRSDPHRRGDSGPSGSGDAPDPPPRGR